MISSPDAGFRSPMTASYAVSKAGINSLSKSLSILFHEKKICVNAVAPGWIMTPMIEQNGKEFLDNVADVNPLKKNASPNDITNLISFLVSDKSNYIKWSSTYYRWRIHKLKSNATH